METNVPKRRDKKSLRVKVISLGNAEVGKVKRLHLFLWRYLYRVPYLRSWQSLAIVYITFLEWKSPYLNHYRLNNSFLVSIHSLLCFMMSSFWDLCCFILIPRREALFKKKKKRYLGFEPEVSKITTSVIYLWNVIFHFKIRHILDISVVV